MPAARSGGRLFIVSTPIGNLGDLSHRAVAVLQGSAAILAEDTRHTRQLLDHYGITVPMVAYHEHNEARTFPRVLARLSAGEDLSLVSDAGTPLISDPGARLVSEAIRAGHDVVPIPGASALLAALPASGLDTGRFTFFGFLPRQGRARQSALGAVLATPHTVVLYEAPLRVSATLSELEAAGAGERAVVVARELTKRFEEFRRGTVAELAAYYEDESPRGEVVIMLGPAPRKLPDEVQLADAARRFRLAGLSVRDATRRLVDEFGATRNVAYRLARGVEV